MTQKAITIKDLAEKLNISVSTVSRALKDNPEISQQTRKTVQALAAVAQAQSYPLLLVVPPHLVTNWQREIQSFLQNADGSEPSVHVIRGLKPYELPEAQIYIIHYLLLRGWKTALPQIDFEAVVFDEIQELRHSGTEKYSAASLLAEKAPRVWGLSGTAIYNRGGEIWNVINILDFHALGDWESFTREWCYGYGNNIVAKPDLLGETPGTLPSVPEGPTEQFLKLFSSLDDKAQNEIVAEMLKRKK